MIKPLHGLCSQPVPSPPAALAEAGLYFGPSVQMHCPCASLLGAPDQLLGCGPPEGCSPPQVQPMAVGSWPGRGGWREGGLGTHSYSGSCEPCLSHVSRGAQICTVLDWPSDQPRYFGCLSASQAEIYCLRKPSRNNPWVLT